MLHGFWLAAHVVRGAGDVASLLLTSLLSWVRSAGERQSLVETTPLRPYGYRSGAEDVKAAVRRGASLPPATEPGPSGGRRAAVEGCGEAGRRGLPDSSRYVRRSRDTTCHRRCSACGEHFEDIDAADKQHLSVPTGKGQQVGPKTILLLHH